MSPTHLRTAPTARSVLLPSHQGLALCALVVHLAQCAPCHGMQLLAHCASSLHSQLPVLTWLSETPWTTSSAGAVCRADVWTWLFLSNCQYSCWSSTQSAVRRRQSGVGHGPRMPTSGRQPSRPASARSSSCGTCHRASSPMAGATLGALASAADMHVPLSDPPRASGSFNGSCTVNTVDLTWPGFSVV